MMSMITKLPPYNMFANEERQNCSAYVACVKFREPISPLGVGTLGANDYEIGYRSIQYSALVAEM